MGKIYSLHDYASMIADRQRMDAYREAISRAVMPGAIVLDLGAGPGVFALLACMCGAAKVYAVEPNDVVHIGRQLAADNGFSDRIEFIQARSTKVALREKADLMISDLRGTLPLHGTHLPDIIDARHRLLRDGGSMIPRLDKLWVAVWSSEKRYEQHGEPWKSALPDLKLTPLTDALLCIPRKISGDRGEFLTAPHCWSVLDYATIDNADVSGVAEWHEVRKGWGHGLCIWFDSVLAEGSHITNSPASLSLNYGSMFFPWTKPVFIEEGNHIRVRLRAWLQKDQYSWCWQTEIHESDYRSQKKALFDQTHI